MPGLTPNLDLGLGSYRADTATQSDIIDAINRQSDQLDSFSNKLSFESDFDLTIAWDGTANFFANASFQHNLGYTPSFMSFYTFETDDAGKWYPGSDQRIDNTGVVTQEVEVGSTNGFILFTFAAIVTGTPQNIKLKGYLLREPAQQS